MYSYARGVAAVFLLCGLAGCADGSLSTLPASSSTARLHDVSGDSIPIVDLPGEPSDAPTGECTLVRVQDGTAEGSWESLCDGISGGTTLPPPPLPPPPPPPNFPPPPYDPPSGGGGGTGDGSGGTVAPDQESGLLCKAATTAWLAALAVEKTEQAKYQAAYEAYMLKRTEYTAWDNQAKADGVYTWPEQSMLNELGNQLWTLETTMKAAKAAYDDAARLQLLMAASMAVACGFGL